MSTSSSVGSASSGRSKALKPTGASPSSTIRSHRALWPRRCIGTRGEDEYSYVLEGTLGALLGDEVVTAGPGTWVFKPRDQWHTFWNAGDTPCEIIEIISPAGFENFFRELADVYAAEGGPDLERFGALCGRYGLEMDPDSVPGLCERFGLNHPMA